MARRRGDALGALGAIVRGVVGGASERELLSLVGRGVLECLAPADAVPPPLRAPRTVRASDTPAQVVATMPRASTGKARVSKGSRSSSSPASPSSDGAVSGEVLSVAEVRAAGVRVDPQPRPRYRRT